MENRNAGPARTRASMTCRCTLRLCVSGVLKGAVMLGILNHELLTNTCVSDSHRPGGFHLWRRFPRGGHEAAVVEGPFQGLLHVQALWYWRPRRDSLRPCKSCVCDGVYVLVLLTWENSCFPSLSAT